MATKKIIEKKTGEKYASKAAMMKHEKGESKAMEKKEMAKGMSPMKQVKPSTKAPARPTKGIPTPPTKMVVTKKTVIKAAPAKMRKC
jgi:hypothetical protein